jgi:Tol biopolymer transport system component
MVSLIARAALFGNPVRTQARLSPHGRYVSFLAPKDGVLNVWLAPFANLQAAKPITDDKTRGVRAHYWAFTESHVLYVQDEGGDENWRVLSVDVESGRDFEVSSVTVSAGAQFVPGIAAALAARHSSGAR